MTRKLRDYFDCGIPLVWYIDPADRTARVYTSPTDCTQLGGDQALDGAAMLPGFRLPLRQLFAELDDG